MNPFDGHDLTVRLPKSKLEVPTLEQFLKDNFEMNLTETDYTRLQPHFLAIERSSRTGSVSDVAPWYVMDEIKRMRTGFSSDGRCPACVIELYHEFQNALVEYEKGKQIEGKRYTDFMMEGVR